MDDHHYESGYDDYMDDVAAEEWWLEETADTRELLDTVTATAGVRDGVVGPEASVVMASVRRLTARAEEYLEDPDATYPLASGAYEPLDGISRTGLEVADALAHTAWNLLTAAIRRTCSLRARIELALAARRVASLRIRIAGHKGTTLRTTPARALTPAAWALRSLTRAAHGPPLPGPYRLSAITGGGPL